MHEYFLRMRHEELLEEAERFRLIEKTKQLQGNRFGYYGKLLALLGSILCNLGGWLVKRFGDEVAINHTQSIDSSLEV